jgi:hypothetical protein
LANIQERSDFILIMRVVQMALVTNMARQTGFIYMNLKLAVVTKISLLVV